MSTYSYGSSRYMAEIVQTRDHQCDICGRRFHSRDKLTRHRRNVHGPVIHCPEERCTYHVVKGRANMMRNHIRRVHEETRTITKTRLTDNAKTPTTAATRNNMDTTTATTRHKIDTATATTKHNMDTTTATNRHNIDTATATTRHNINTATATTRHNMDTATVTTRHNIDTATATTRHNIDTATATTRHNMDTTTATNRHNIDTATATTRHNMDTAPATTRHMDTTQNTAKDTTDQQDRNIVTSTPTRNYSAPAGSSESPDISVSDLMGGLDTSPFITSNITLTDLLKLDALEPQPLDLKINTRTSSTPTIQQTASTELGRTESSTQTETQVTAQATQTIQVTQTAQATQTVQDNKLHQLSTNPEYQSII